MLQREIYDAYGGVVSTVTVDPMTKAVTFEQIQDVDPILEDNKRLQALNDGYSPSRELKRKASIPVVVLLDWLRKDGISPRMYFRRPKAYAGWLRKKLHDPDHRYFLTAPLKR